MKAVGLANSAQVAAVDAKAVAATKFTAPSTGGVERQVSEKLADLVSVKDFGAVADGTTDSTAAIQAACDALPNGGTVYFPGHDTSTYYRATGQITIDNPYIVFLGGSRSTTLQFDDGSYTAIKTSVGSAQAGLGFTARNMDIRGSTTSSPSLLLMDFTNNSPYVTIDNCHLGFCDTCVRLGDSYVIKITNNQLNNCQTAITAVSDGSQADLIIMGNTFGTMIDGTPPCLDIQFAGAIIACNYFETQRRNKLSVAVRTGTQHLIFANNLFKVENGQALLVESSNIVAATGNIFAFCYDDTTRRMIRVDGGSTLVMTGNYVDGRPFGGDTDNINGISSSGVLVLNGNQIAQCEGTAVAANDMTGVGNTFSANNVALALSNNTATESIIAANRFSNNTTDLTVGNGDHIIALNNADTITKSSSTAGYFGNAPEDVLVHELSGQATYNPANLTDGARTAVSTLTVSRAALGDYVAHISFSLDLQGVDLRAWVSAADTVSYYFQNNTGGTVDLASGTIRCIVRKGS